MITTNKPYHFNQYVYTVLSKSFVYIERLGLKRSHLNTCYINYYVYTVLSKSFVYVEINIERLGLKKETEQVEQWVGQ